ncbi:glycosyltransferase [Actinoplanes subtropicus]|uniref:glycosyltransferase n=1 Tax=Actinoplanes subtropicus TaxID=543632 RepID=UPI0007C57661|nr:glycosyltransferase [Actinoplanes subtropicus]
MRIAMVHSSFAIRGGAEQYVRDLTGALRGRGHDVQVFSRDSVHADPADRAVHARVSDRLGGRSNALRKAFTHLGDVADPTGLSLSDIRAFAPDLVHVHNWQGLGALPLARLARAYPICHTVHDYALADPNNALANRGRSTALDAALQLRSAWLVGRFRRVTLLWPAERTREIVERHVPAARGLPGRVVPLAVPEEGPPPVWRRGHTGTFLFLGALSPHKGVDLMLDAWRSAAALAPPGARLLVAGDGPLRDLLAATARDVPSVRPLGFLDAAGKQAALQEAGWLLFPSQWAENFPISCVETLRAGRPILASTVARPPMASDGALLTFDGREDLVAVLRRAMTMPPPEYDRMAGVAAADGRALSWEAHVSAIERAYAEVAADTVAGPPAAPDASQR